MQYGKSWRSSNGDLFYHVPTFGNHKKPVNGKDSLMKGAAGFLVLLFLAVFFLPATTLADEGFEALNTGSEAVTSPEARTLPKSLDEAVSAWRSS
jgi:hypothetical protein